MESHIKRYAEQAELTTTINAQNIIKMDSAGTLLFHTLISQLQSLEKSLEIQGLNQNTKTFTAILCEFAPLITDIIAAGRTSTAFTVQISTMKVNEEIDVLNTMGVSPLEPLVLPKFFTLLITLTLLMAWADIFAVFGSMLMAKSQLDIGYVAYLDRFQHAIPLRHYVWGMGGVGLIKA
ncbi:MlaE family ABC transporter permease [Candidatus Coxiella mudrowiae]|uniref:MlaE family ABC transporter permease n=1 Tax=Candidatus Coxiella mudrowiae TaxID=2054173 RepID=UPI0027D291A8|nr:ABC transporter permease [Candidatus Coxiella mudrowiae]